MNPRFLNIINSSKPVLVDFYSQWCEPCKQITPILKKVKEELSQVKIIKVDVDKNPYIASHCKVSKIPSLLLFREGKLLWSGEGVFNAEELKSILLESLHRS
jgi:thioredoxin 1